MKMELKNDNLLVKFDAKWDILQIENALASSGTGLILPESAKSVSVDPLSIGYSQIPVLVGEIVDVGPGKKKIKGEGRTLLPGIEAGRKIMFQVNSQIAYRDKSTNEIYYLIGSGNVLAFLEEEDA